MTARSIYAYTGPTGPGYPAYVNLSRDGQDGHDFRLIVRSPAKYLDEFATEGATGTMVLERPQLIELLKALAAELGVPVSRRL
jgi:hypothetical protein